MDGLIWTTCCGPMIQLVNETVLVRGRTLCDYGIIEAEILRRRGNPFDLIRRAARQLEAQARADKNLLPCLFDEVVARWCRVSFRDACDWLDTWPGRIFGLWLAVRDNDPKRYTFDHLVRIANRLHWPVLLQAVEIASGEDERAATAWLMATEGGDLPPISWSAIYRRLSAHPFGMSARDVGNLTLPQLRVYLDDQVQVSDRIGFDSAAEMEEWGRRRKKSVTAAVENLRCGMRWDSRSEG